jgi:hypothetical protein
MYTRGLPTTLAALLLLTTSLFSQSIDDEFVSGQARFAIRPSSSAQVAYRGVNEDVGTYSIFGDGFSWNDELRYVEVLHLIAWPSKIPSRSLSLSPSGKALILRHYINVFKADFAKHSATVVESPFVLNGSTGVELRVSGEHRSLVRQFFQNDRFYILIAQNKKAAGYDEQKRILDTFRRLSFDEYNAAMIRESEPAALPQNVPTGVRPTDAIERALKGGIKKIVEEMESGASKKREILAEEHFSRLGYLTRKVTYNEGYAESIANYGWVDGVRAVNLSPVTHRGEGLIVTRGTVVGWGMPKGYNVVTRSPTGQIVDLRFTSKFESKYDDQWLLIERRETSNSGSINFVERTNYSASGRDVKTEDGSGGFITRRFEVLDKSGNITELRTLDDRGGVLSSQKFRYEFDPKGNWVVRRSTGTQRPGVPRIGSATHYRKIEYYE